jgi:hypothetical protein
MRPAGFLGNALFSGRPDQPSACYLYVSDLLQLLDADFLDLGLPNLIGHPSWSSFGLIDLHSLSSEQVDLLCASLSQLNICETPICGL